MVARTSRAAVAVANMLTSRGRAADEERRTRRETGGPRVGKSALDQMTLQHLSGQLK